MTQMPPSLLDPPETGANSERIERQFPSMHLTRSSRFARRLGKLLVALLSVASFAAFAVPWQQSIRGEGTVVAFDPYERPQWVYSQVKGRIVERGPNVRENAYVEKGQFLFRVENQDPNYLERLKFQEAAARAEVQLSLEQVDHAKDNLRAAEAAVVSKRHELTAFNSARDFALLAQDAYVRIAETKLLAEQDKQNAAKAEHQQKQWDFDRKRNLEAKGLESELNMQKAELDFMKAVADLEVAIKTVSNANREVEAKKQERDSKRQEWLAKINKVQSELNKAQGDVAKAEAEVRKVNALVQQKESKLQDQSSKLSRQETQEVHAPTSGYIHGLDVFDGQPVKEQQPLCRIVPKMTSPAVQVWVAGNDQPFIQPGRHVRLQFEGWPAVQFSGWPSVAVGTFGGEVASVDATDNGMGRFRVLIIPDEEDALWPEHPYLRQGVRTNGWVLLDQVPLGFEVWRRMNGFPPALDEKAADSAKTPKPPKIKI